MHFIPALAASALVLRASAFLVPLEISRAAEQAKPELASLLASAGHSVDLDCPGCPWFGAEDSARPDSEVETKIVRTCPVAGDIAMLTIPPQHLALNVDPQQGLTINNIPVFPSNPADAALPHIVEAPQIRVEDGQQAGPLKLDFALERLPPITSAEEPFSTILPIRFTILGLEGYPIKVDTIAIDLLQTPDQILIVRVSNIPFENTPGATTCETTSKWSLCRLRAIIATRLQAIMEAAKTRSQAAKGWVDSKGCGGRNFGGKGMRHGHGRHGHHMGPHHPRAHRLGHILHQTLRFFVIPALLGVIGGLMASAVGMLVGQLISYLWIRYHRNGQRGPVRVIELVVEEDEKDALMTEDLPSPPQYQDLDVVVTEDQKH